ncbi:MAG: type II secretion system protein GspM [Desulfobacteraceae bacterium]|nr:type II secretion system protein GspM [Desulfobacteraceae bacterium]
MFNIDQRKKYIFTIGLILLILAIFYRTYPIVESAYPTEEKIALLKTQFAGYKHQFEKSKQLKSKIQQSTNMLIEFETHLFKGETPALAAVEIQSILDQIASENNMEISSIQVLKGKKIQIGLPYGNVNVRLTFASTISKFKSMLYAIDTSSKFLKVTEITVRSSSRKKDDNRLLDVTMTVAGLMDLSSKISGKE